MSTVENQVCFQLYTGSRLMQRMYRPYFDEWGITYPQYLVLICLWERDGQTIVELSDPLDLDSGTLSPLLKRMEKNGLVSREHDTNDFRRIHFSLTQKGKDLEPVVRKMQVELCGNLGLTWEDLATLKKLMLKINPSQTEETEFEKQ